MIKLLSLADLISLSNVIFGFISILVLISGLFPDDSIRIRISFSFILLALLADGFDGIVARKTGKSQIGSYLEAMGDMTSMGIASSVFVYSVYYNSFSNSLENHIFMIFVLIFFLTLGVIRLSSFHIMKDDAFFIGLPASASTIIILGLAFIKIDFIYILLTILILSIFMISNIRFPKPNLKINFIAFLLICITLILGKNYSYIGPILLIFAILLYCIFGPIYLKFFQKKQ